MTHMKRSARIVLSQTMRCVKSYLNGTSILDLARRYNYPPSMMARLVVENMARAPSPSPSTPAGAAPAAATGTPSGHLDDGGADGAAGEGASAAGATDPMNGDRGGGGGRVGRRFLTNALRYPEKALGDARASISPEYLFSEGNGAAPLRDDDRGGLDLAGDDSHRHDPPRERPPATTATPPAIPLSRLSREVREAVDSDPMYGESIGSVGSGCYRPHFPPPRAGRMFCPTAANFSSVQKKNERPLERTPRTPTGQGEAQRWHRVRVFARGDATIDG